MARRNSSLGRLAPPSQRLLLDLDFLRQAPACIEALAQRGRDELAELLRDSHARKRRQLPALIFNATLGNAEYRDFWRPSPLPDAYPASTGSTVVADLAAVTGAARRWLSGDYSGDGDDLELHLGGVARGDGGELLRALAQQSAYLDATTRLLEARAQRGALCRAGLQPRAALILRTVARRYFVAGVQRRAAALERRRRALLPAVRELESLLATVLPVAYAEWQRARDRDLAHWSGAAKRHVRGLQGLLGSCFDEFAASPRSPRAPRRGAGDALPIA